MCGIDLCLHHVIDVKTAKREGFLVFPGARHLPKSALNQASVLLDELALAHLYQPSPDRLPSKNDAMDTTQPHTTLDTSTNRNRCTPRICHENHQNSGFFPCHKSGPLSPTFSKRNIDNRCYPSKDNKSRRYRVKERVGCYRSCLRGSEGTGRRRSYDVEVPG
jgi:hypothetical protein